MKNSFIISFLFWVFMSCENLQLVTATPGTPTTPTVSKDEPNSPPPAFDIQGHRGAMGLMPPNTIPAFLKGLELGVTTLEMDAAITKDNKVIISHDGFFLSDITTKPDKSKVNKQEEKSSTNNIYMMDYEQVKKYDVGSVGTPYFPEQRKFKVAPPLLSDVIDSAETYSKKIGRPLPFYNIEIKSYKAFDNIFYPEVEKYTDLVMAVILQKNISGRVFISSFDLRALKYMHQKYPEIKLGLYANLSDNLSFNERLNQLGFTPEFFGPNYQAVDSQMITDCTAKGVKVIPYTVNEVADMKRLKAIGASGLITDMPNRAKGL
jgi:glycerophosphoryl diester phosphodiesterase